MLYPDGARYDGGFRAGLRDGRGSYTFPGGAQFVGRFAADGIDAAAAASLMLPHPVASGPDEWMIPVATQLGEVHARAGFDKKGL